MGIGGTTELFSLLKAIFPAAHNLNAEMFSRECMNAENGHAWFLCVC